MHVTLREDDGFGPSVEIEVWAGAEMATITVPGFGLGLSKADLDDDDAWEAVTPQATFEEILRRAGHMAAYFFLVGEMYVDDESRISDERDQHEASAAVKAMRERGELTITVEDVVAARREVARANQGIADTVTLIGKIMQEEGLRRGLNKEERAELTLGEVFGKAKDDE
jgi:hypothetical protein